MKQPAQKKKKKEGAQRSAETFGILKTMAQIVQYCEKLQMF